MLWHEADTDVLRCCECRRPPFYRNSSVIGNFWASVLATGRLSTSVVHACRPSLRNNEKPVKDGLLMPPERPWIDSCTAASCRPQLVGDRRPPCRPYNIETRASIPCQSQRSHQMPLRLFDLYFADDGVGGRSSGAQCRVCRLPA